MRRPCCCAAILLAAFVLPSQIMRFWAFSGTIAIIVLLAWDLASGDPRLQPALLIERMEDMAIGAALVLVFTATLSPRITWTLLAARLAKRG
jgi:hypothetical protein